MAGAEGGKKGKKQGKGKRKEKKKCACNLMISKGHVLCRSKTGRGVWEKTGGEIRRGGRKAGEKRKKRTSRGVKGHIKVKGWWEA